MGDTVANLYHITIFASSLKVYRGPLNSSHGDIMRTNLHSQDG